MSELENYMAGRVTVFQHNGDDALLDSALLVEVTDTASGDIEFAFDMPRTKTRVYLRVPQDAVRRLLVEQPA